MDHWAVDEVITPERMSTFFLMKLLDRVSQLSGLCNRGDDLFESAHTDKSNPKFARHCKECEQCRLVFGDHLVKITS